MRACLISVGGSTEPILHVLQTYRPEFVAYVCSPASRAHLPEIQACLDFNPRTDILEVAAFEDLGPCYAALRTWLPGWLGLHDIQPDEVMVDYTGGTKTMSAALVLAATEVFSHFSYVGGAQRDQAGTGRVITGSERLHYQGNPWRELAVRELEQAGQLWRLQQYDAVIALFRRARTQMPREQHPALERATLLAGALADRLSLQLPAAARKLDDLARKLRKSPASAAGIDARAALLSFCERGSRRFSAASGLSGPSSDAVAQLRELLDNALLTAELGRYDDGAARLYRALELFGQNELSRLTDSAFALGRLKAETIPMALKNFAPFSGPDGWEAARRGISLEQVYRALAHLDHPAGRRAVAEFDGPDALRTPWRQGTQRRNQSILAHGLQPVGADGFKALAALVADYTAEDLSRVDLNAPTFDPAWFHLNPQT